MEERMLIDEARSAANEIELKGFPYTAIVLRDCAVTLERLVKRQAAISEAALIELTKIDQELYEELGPTPFRGRKTRRD